MEGRNIHQLTDAGLHSSQKFFWSIVYMAGLKACKQEAADEPSLGADWRRQQGSLLLRSLHRTLAAKLDARAALDSEVRPCLYTCTR